SPRGHACFRHLEAVGRWSRARCGAGIGHAYRWRPDASDALRTVGAEVIGSAADGMGLSLLVARPGGIAADAVSAALRSAGGADVRGSEVGAHADRIDASALRERAI